MPLLSAWRTRSALTDLLGDIRPDVVHAHYLSRAGWLAWLAGRRPWVVTGWGSDLLLDPWRTWRGRIRSRLILRSADLVTVPSHGLRDAAVALGARPARVHVVPFGVDTSAFTPDEPNRAVLTEAGISMDRIVFSPRSIRRLYRQDLVVRALAGLPPGTIAVMTARNADPETLSDIRRLARSLDVERQLHILDDIRQDLLHELYRAARVVVSVPDSDGMPVSVLEAMASGTPVVVSDLSGPREALGPAANRLVIPRGDAAALAKAIRAVMEMEPPDRSALASALRERAVSEFDFRTAMLRMEHHYHALAGQ